MVRLRGVRGNTIVSARLNIISLQDEQLPPVYSSPHHYLPAMAHVRGAYRNELPLSLQETELGLEGVNMDPEHSHRGADDYTHRLQPSLPSMTPPGEARTSNWRSNTLADQRAVPDEVRELPKTQTIYSPPTESQPSFARVADTRGSLHDGLSSTLSAKQKTQTEKSVQPRLENMCQSLHFTITIGPHQRMIKTLLENCPSFSRTTG